MNTCHWRIQGGGALLFSHTFSPKSVRIGGRCPPQRVSAPPTTGNPGSATACHGIRNVLYGKITLQLRYIYLNYQGVTCICECFAMQCIHTWQAVIFVKRLALHILTFRTRNNVTILWLLCQCKKETMCRSHKRIFQYLTYAFHL